MSQYHTPVLLEESVGLLDIRPDGTYADLTFGGGGHSRRILSDLGPEGRLYGFDQDRDTRANCPDDPRFHYVESNFRFLRGALRYRGVTEVDGILGTGSYTEIVPAIEKLLNGEQVVDFGSIDAPEVETGRIMTTAGHYAFIKIAEGCDNHCSYCVIPSLRGKYRSRQMDDVLYEARMLADSGVKELIVVAQDTSRYGTDLPGHKRLLPELLRKLCEIDGLHWIRVHYVYPDEIDDEFIQVMASEPKIVKYLDIPIQHCNSKILKLMNRRGDGEFLKALFARLRAGIPGLVIRTSLITGLPGEGEEEFAELCDFLREERLERVGAFAFSPEEGTPAAQMEHVDTDTAVKRAEIVEMLQSEIMDAYNAEKLGKTMEVLVDGYDEESGQFYGRTFADSPDIDGRVWIASDEPVHEGDFVMVKIDGCTDGDLCGYVVEEEA